MGYQCKLLPCLHVFLHSCDINLVGDPELLLLTGIHQHLVIEHSTPHTSLCISGCLNNQQIVEHDALVPQ